MNLSTIVIEKLFESVEKIENIPKFYELIEFIKAKKVKPSDFSLKVSSILEIQKTLEMNLLCDRLIGLRQDKKDIQSTIENLINKNWSFDDLNNLNRIYR